MRVIGHFASTQYWSIDRNICQNIIAHLQFSYMVNRHAIKDLLEPFNIPICDDSIDKLIVYLDLLIRWNQKINLTAVRSPQECVTRHFGESLLLSRINPLKGSLLDIGSGAGFPGLAIKVIAPELDVFLLEPIGKKRAFLKEVARSCGFHKVNVLETRLEEYSQSQSKASFDIITVRAVGGLVPLFPATQALLKSGGSLCLWVGRQQGQLIQEANSTLTWNEPLPIPLSNDRQILSGTNIRPRSS